MGQHEERPQDLELLDDFIEFDKSTLLRIIQNGENQALSRIRAGDIPLSEKDVKHAARKLRQGVELMDTKTLWAIIFQLKAEIDNLIYMQKMKKQIETPTVISKSGAELFYSLKFNELMQK